MATSTSTAIAPGQEWVTEEDVKRSIAELRQKTLRPEEGLFGRDSIFREVNKHAVVYLPGAVHAVQMQLAHPWIAVAVREHSKIMSDPRKRAQMTYTFLWSIIYGDMDMVARKALGLYKMHSRVSGSIHADAGAHAAGSTYAANERVAMLWVHVTAFYSRVKLYEKIIRPLTAEEKDRFCQEAKLYAMCFSIPESMHPDTWQDVEDYIAAMQRSDTLAVTDEGLAISQFLKNLVPAPLRTPFWALTSLSVPARTREILGLPEDSAATRKSAQRMVRLLKLANFLMPRQIAWVPAYTEAERRMDGKNGPDWLTAKLNTLMIGVPRLVS